MKFIEKLWQQSGVTKNRFARKLGVPPQAVHQWIDKCKDIKGGTIVLIKQKLGLTWDQMGKMLEEEFKE